MCLWNTGCVTIQIIREFLGLLIPKGSIRTSGIIPSPVRSSMAALNKCSLSQAISHNASQVPNIPKLELGVSKIAPQSSGIFRCFTSSIWVCLTIGCPKNCWLIIGSQMFPMKFIGIPHWQTDPYHPRSIRNTSWGPEPRSHPPAVGSLPWAASAPCPWPACPCRACRLCKRYAYGGSPGEIGMQWKLPE